MRLQKQYGLACLALIGAIIPTACGDDPGRAPEGPPGGSGGDRGGSSSRGGSSKGGSAGDDVQAGDGGSAGDGSATGGSSGDSGSSSGGASGKGGSNGTGGTAGTTTSTCDDPWSEPNTSTECDIYELPMSTTVMLSGEITSNMTLETGNAYRLDGPTSVMSGATLTIQPCVRIEGQSPTSVLAIRPGGKIEAEGEEDQPIVFTSAEPVGSRAPGDWGGLIILGNARVNQATSPTSKPEIEGLVMSVPYGNHTDDFNTESSGTLAYVRVEYSGRDLGMNNETNGITLGGVGSGTVMHHVMSSNSLDDCFEWFGGTVNAHHLIALNCDDDMFDTDFGFRGTVQFAFGRLYPTTAEGDSSGFEMDSAAASPATDARWSNVTLCGNDSRTSPRLGIILRTGVAGSITNTLVTGFHGGAIASRNQSPATMTFTSLFGNDELLAPAHEGGGAWFTDQDGNSIEAPDGFCDCWADPPNPFPVGRIPGGPPPAGAVDTEADYQGAFLDGLPENNWMTGKWVDWSEN